MNHSVSVKHSTGGNIVAFRCMRKESLHLAAADAPCAAEDAAAAADAALGPPDTQFNTTRVSTTNLCESRESC